MLINLHHTSGDVGITGGKGSERLMRKTSWFSIGLVFILLTQSSRLDHSQSQVTPPQAQEKPAPPTPMAEQKAELGDDETWNPVWDKIVEDALPADLLSSKKVAKDVKNFCPRFSSLPVADKRAYWAYFFQALAGAEAGLRTTADVRHTEPEVAV